jgi:hypothetical protein
MKATRQAYRAHSVAWWAEQVPGTNFWKGKASISIALGRINPKRLEGPDDRFVTEDEARDYIFQAAKSWIDNKLK